MKESLDEPLVSDDPLLETSKIIYDNHIQHLKHHKRGKLNPAIIATVSILLTITTILTIFFLQYTKYTDYINKTYGNKTNWLCYTSQISTIDIISTPISLLLIVFYVVIYKRRVFMREKFAFRNFGIPMICSPWRKVN